jgi:NADPH:quinone reductase-like Zn-dependent oxidoreductase
LHNQATVHAGSIERKMSPLIPPTMRSLAINSYCRPDKYEIVTIPTPQISQPDHVLVKVHASSINPNDMEMAGGMAKMIITQT